MFRSCKKSQTTSIADPGQPGRGDDTGNNPGVVEPCLA